MTAMPAEKRCTSWITWTGLALLIMALVRATSTHVSGEDEPVRPTATTSLLHDICAHVPDRPPTVINTGRLQHLPGIASRVPHTFHVCESRSIHCHAIINLTSPFTEQRPAPAALGLTPGTSYKCTALFTSPFTSLRTALRTARSLRSRACRAMPSTLCTATNALEGSARPQPYVCGCQVTASGYIGSFGGRLVLSLRPGHLGGSCRKAAAVAVAAVWTVTS